MDGNAAPVTAGNFVDLIKRGVYEGTIFHRVIKEPIPFVVQGGDPSTKKSNTPVEHYGRGQFINPLTREARFIPLEIKLKDEPLPAYGKLFTQPKDLLRVELTHQKGAIAMARAQSENSASAQFYIALRSLPELDGRYAVFGRVTKGMNVIQSIEKGDKILKATAKFLRQSLN